ncbi:MAG TPA: hypothetical protein VEH05_10840, partial [Streptosporangiaceae bacterium]|nr:hypothetical protein [Streptosporangiaceae bacterium]
MSAAESAARKRPRTSGQQPRTVEDEAAMPGRPSGPGPRDTGEHGSEARADADAAPESLAAVGLDEDDVVALNARDLDTEDLDDEDFDDLDADEADIQAALAEGDLDEPDLADVVSVADDLVGDDLVGDDTDGVDALEGPEPGAAPELDTEADAESEGPGAAGALVVKITPDGGEDEEILVFGDDDDDLPAAQVAVAGATAD